MPSDAIPTRGDAGLAALDIFYTGFNEVNIYFEDEDQENLYQLIVNKILPQYRITRLFPLGGKSNVLKHARDPENSERGGKLVYILDKDFDDVLGKVVIIPNVFYLDKYCIENFLIEKAALVEVVIQSYPKIRRNSVEAKLQIDDYLLILHRSLDKLFRLFCCVQMLDLGMKNCKQKPEIFTVKDKPWEIDRRRFDAYKEAVVLVASLQGKISSAADLSTQLLRICTRRIAMLIPTSAASSLPRYCNTMSKISIQCRQRHSIHLYIELPVRAKCNNCNRSRPGSRHI